MNPRRRTAPRLRSSRTLPQGSGRSGRVCAGRAAGGDPRPAPRRQAEGRPGPGGRAACAAHFRGDVAQGGELVRPTVPGRGEPVPAERGVGAGPASARHVVLERPPGTVTSPRKPSGTRMKEPRPRGSFAWDSTGQSPLALVGAGGGFALYWVWGKGGDRNRWGREAELDSEREVFRAV